VLGSAGLTWLLAFRLSCSAVSQTLPAPLTLRSQAINALDAKRWKYTAAIWIAMTLSTPRIDRVRRLSQSDAILPYDCGLTAMLQNE
jgi:hypothetical protein